ncbi:Mitochondrial uncoupling protein 2 [Cryptotermes secundus]|uniref:Mitochondrial uncoupling protein 2 n=1 Tax=Cryptotermes secundus TaxID=105785 RepID=A0A2J7R3X6_9NEOP|nr:mitochondrial uncoupling protein 2 [Cryptotermes secundus]XP_023705761.1 mitochondrial uncoupling protein 2 [Cryptotermes secundus]PNF35520.1 Mitochondrial uncoupling protein 2 [Cryptotermes secundus]PNF35521.1 Mitochondrial uncoupling protein 2 [Cryptotermes secundus]
MKLTDSDTPLAIKLLTAGTAGCIADFASFPLDTAKVRLQIQGEGHMLVAVNPGNALLVRGTTPSQYNGLMGTIITIARQEGVRSLYSGLSAGLQRQMCFASVRLGLYDSVKSLYQQLLDGNRSGGLHVGTRISAGLTTGALAVLLAQPTDVVKVRFQAQQRALGTETAPRYKSTVQAYRTIAKQEGARGLWKGTFPNVSRNAIVNVSEIVCYDIVKDLILQHSLMRDAVPCHFTSAVISGFCATVAASPVDVVKTRYMNSTRGEYRSAVDCALRMLAQEGPAAFYKGFIPSFCRLVSWNIVMWITYEQFKLAVINMRQELN